MKDDKTSGVYIFPAENGFTITKSHPSGPTYMSQVWVAEDLGGLLSVINDLFSFQEQAKSSLPGACL